ncbi:glycosyltransferase family 4 protein [Clostridium thermobutyricum]
MKILIVGNSTIGLFKFRKELISRILELRNEVVVAVPNDGLVDEIKSLGCSVRIIDLDRRGKNVFSELKLIFRYKKLIKEEKPDKIITYTIKPNIYCGIISRIYKKEFYPNITGLGTAFQCDSFIKKIVSTLYRIAFRNVNKVFFENTENREIFIKEKICNKEKTVVLNGAGVNLEEFKQEPLPSFETINFIFMGRIMKEKGIEELFYVIKEIKKEYINTNFFILGGFEENYKEELEKMNKEGLLIYYGIQKDVRKYIRKAHCCILPSYHEGMSNTLLECAAMGRALITSNIPGCKEVVIDGKSGFLTEVRNKEDLKEKVLKYINSTNNDKKKMGLLSRKHIESNFDKNEIVNQTIENVFI